MCEFCEPTKEEVENYWEWQHTNPYNGDGQVDYEGIDYLLDAGVFNVGCKFDGGYLSDIKTFAFNYCPMCGRKL